jgi:hypothetical protein
VNTSIATDIPLRSEPARHVCRLIDSLVRRWHDSVYLHQRLLETERPWEQVRCATKNAAVREHLESLPYSLLACFADDLSRSEDDVVESAMENHNGGEPCRSVS